MKKLTSKELRELYFDYFINHNHVLIPSASLIPENDPTVLFTTAGMHPLVPYLLGEKHPAGNRLCNVQKCIRTTDIDEVGDAFHLTFFEMLGNWSFGDYFKNEAIAMSYEYLTNEKYLGIPKEKLFFTVFAGDEEIPKDEETYQAWLNQGVKEDHIFFLGREENFWILGSGLGPCGPCTEMFLDTGKDKCNADCNPSCSCGKFMEIWNDVFMQYRKDEQGNLTPLTRHNVDTGMGLERAMCVLNGSDVYNSELFSNLKTKLEELSNNSYDENLESFRIIMDHMRTSTFILGDNQGISPSNVGQGYVLRRLIRRVIRHLRKLNIENSVLTTLAEVIVNDYKYFYPELDENKDFIYKQLEIEETKFKKTLKEGEKWFYKTIKHIDGDLISGADAFKLFDTFGFPIEMTEELAKENHLEVDKNGFDEAFKVHQEKSKTLDQGAFKGGLADDSYMTTKYHTLAHLTLAALQKMYGKDIMQKGANITSERLRFDFNLDHKMLPEEIKQLEDLVNASIAQGIDVIMEEMSYDEAKLRGAHGQFDAKYGSIVKVYIISDVSLEICGGPHVKNTSELGKFKVIKEESSASGIRRIKAILE